MKKDRITYPDGILDLLKVPELRRLIRQDMGSSPLLANELEFLLSPPIPSEVYVKYLSPDAENPVKVADQIRQAASQMMRGTSSADLDKWSKIVALMRKDIIKRFDSKIVPAFYQRDIFRKWHEQTAIAKAKANMGDPKKVAKKLDLDEHYDANILEKYMIAQALGRTDEAAKIEKKLREGHATDLRHIEHQVRKRKEKEATGKTEAERTGVDLTPAKLLNCGFRNVSEKKLREAIMKFSTAVLTAKKADQKAFFKKIQALEPESGIARNMTIENLVKTMRKKGVINEGVYKYDVYKP
ncbi:hypothetical protein SAMN04488056_105203 [Cohaesibacter marisflavi]|uniref:Uncharacterized protein n=1 Tax=Cohaesibacter marisflavi TaxID=655353 RepID=A0A1I5GWT1_9HYPH|nr:hypothetical protein [Cohaesibacter marisflavi]SFO40031.1 hypothetical protein SAMN04488056_105203 [Cohaesibacter marisflavi]